MIFLIQDWVSQTNSKPKVELGEYHRYENKKSHQHPKEKFLDFLCHAIWLSSDMGAAAVQRRFIISYETLVRKYKRYVWQGVAVAISGFEEQVCTGRRGRSDECVSGLSGTGQ
jgi:hypothetical protein